MLYHTLNLFFISGKLDWRLVKGWKKNEKIKSIFHSGYKVAEHFFFFFIFAKVGLMQREKRKRRERKRMEENNLSEEKKEVIKVPRFKKRKQIKMEK